MKLYGDDIRIEILRLLKEKNVQFEHYTHKPVTTSEEAAQIRNISLETGVKALILKGKKTHQNYLVNIPAHLKLDMKATASTLGERCEFEKPEVIKKRFGLVVGAVPPFGGLFNLETYFDEKIEYQEKSAFNCGCLTESIIMDPEDLIKLIKPKFGAFSKEY